MLLYTYKINNMNITNEQIIEAAYCAGFEFDQEDFDNEFDAVVDFLTTHHLID